MDILRNLSLLPLSGVLKASFKSWLKLTDLNDVNYLAKYGFINDDSENRSISLHPLIQEVVFLEMAPAVSTCRTLIDSLHIICLVHGLEVRKPRNVIDSLISVTEHIIMDEPAVFLLFLQDMFPYLEKYLVTEYLPKVVARIEYVMGCDNDYMKSVYQYLYYLYTRWNKSELAFKYKKKYSDSHTLLR